MHSALLQEPPTSLSGDPELRVGAHPAGSHASPGLPLPAGVTPRVAESSSTSVAETKEPSQRGDRRWASPCVHWLNCPVWSHKCTQLAHAHPTPHLGAGAASRTGLPLGREGPPFPCMSLRSWPLMEDHRGREDTEAQWCSSSRPAHAEPWAVYPQYPHMPLGLPKPVHLVPSLKETPSSLDWSPSSFPAPGMVTKNTHCLDSTVRRRPKHLLTSFCTLCHGSDHGQPIAMPLAPCAACPVSAGYPSWCRYPPNRSQVWPPLTGVLLHLAGLSVFEWTQICKTSLLPRLWTIWERNGPGETKMSLTLLIQARIGLTAWCESHGTSGAPG